MVARPDACDLPGPKKRRSPLSRSVRRAPRKSATTACASGRKDTDIQGREVGRARDAIRRGSDRIAWSGGTHQAGTRRARDHGAAANPAAAKLTREKWSRTEAVRSWERWFAQRGALIETGKAPSIVVKTATELSIAAPSKDGVAEIEVVETQRDPKRPHGPRFGSLVHMAMLRVSLNARRSRHLAAVTSEARMLGADDGEIAAAARAVSLALQSPLVARVQKRPRGAARMPGAADSR